MVLGQQNARSSGWMFLRYPLLVADVLAAQNSSVQPAQACRSVRGALQAEAVDVLARRCTISMQAFW